MSSQKSYWDQKIKDWTMISYGQKVNDVNLIETMANLFRGPISGRLVAALEIIGPRAKNKVILDFGCGLGDFCFGILDYQPKKVIGIDVSPVAIKLAKAEARKRNLGNRIEFIAANVVNIKKLPDFDFAVGLGFIDYLDKNELVKLFRLLQKGYFLFSVFEKKLSLINLIHAIYLKVQKCPGAYKYSKKELRDITSGIVSVRFIDQNKLLFISNLPINEI